MPSTHSVLLKGLLNKTNHDRPWALLWPFVCGTPKGGRICFSSGPRRGPGGQTRNSPPKCHCPDVPGAAPGAGLVSLSSFPCTFLGLCLVCLPNLELLKTLSLSKPLHPPVWAPVTQSSQPPFPPDLCSCRSGCLKCPPSPPHLQFPFML